MNNSNYQILAFIEEPDAIKAFKEIKSSAKKIGERLDHQFLNELEPFKNQNPTAENISRYFYAELSKIVNTDIVQVKSVKLWETDRSAVKYME